jgi:hypothetical protein
MDSGDEIVFTAPTTINTNTGHGLAAPGLKQNMSVALEHKPIDFLIVHDQEDIREVPLSFLGTIAFYLDPDAKIFKIEILNTLEGVAAKENKKRRV